MSPLFRLGDLTARFVTWIWALGICITIALTTSLWQHGERNKLAAVEASVKTLSGQLDLSTATPSAPPEPTGDFATVLPTDVSAEPLVRDLQRFSAASSVKLISVDLATRAATLRSLGRTDISVVLKGDYPEIKSVLQQLLGRHPQLVFQRLSLRKAEGPTELEASFAVLLLSRPLTPTSATSSAAEAVPLRAKN
jgi:hypothetical protein